jgi:transposase
MMTRILKHEPKELLEEGKRVLQSGEDSKFAYRVTMVNLLLEDSKMTTARLSELSGVPTRTLNDWVKKADESGFEALRGRKAPGKAARLTAEQLDKVKEAVADDPTKSGYLRWDGKALSDYIEKTFQVTLGVRQCQRLFHKLGFGRIRPQTFPALEEGQDEARKAFKKKRKT